ncbi:MAG: hypothetical protein Q4B68_03675 [Bacteroidales bacterium]|nr:hypothetical protein [Bacteroidales bacterium]
MQSLTIEAAERFNETQLYDRVCEICQAAEPVRFLLNWQSTPAVTDAREIENWVAGLRLKKECYRILGIWVSGAIGHAAYQMGFLRQFTTKGYWIFEYAPQNH